MRITFVLSVADFSGGVRVVAHHAKELRLRGHEVFVVSHPVPRPSLRRTVASLVKGRGLPKVAPVGPSHLDGTGATHKVLEKYRPVTDRDVPDADVVVATWWETAEWVARLSPAKGAKAQFIQHYEVWGGDAARVDATWRLPMHKIVISHWLKDLARDKFGDADVSHVPNSVDMNQFHAPPRGKQAVPTVGMLYAPVHFKGCDVSIKAFEIARREFPNLRMVSFGDKQPSPEVPLPAATQYTQRPAQDKIKDIYASCDVWLCGSRGEGFHLPPLEAMACRCPVVSTRVGGPLDTVDEGKNGYLVEIEDHAGLADRLARVLRLSDPEWRAMSEAAYRTASRYTWKDAAALFEEALVRAIAVRNERFQNV